MSTPASPIPVPDAASASPSTSPSHHAHVFPRDYRRRSADVGGLHRALAAAAAAASASSSPHGNGWDRMSLSSDGGEGWEGDRVEGAAYPTEYDNLGSGAVPFGAQGQGWMGGEGGDMETMYAELLSDMYNETLNSLNDNVLDATPPPVPENVRTRLIWQLDKWHFEPHRLPDEEVLACTLLLFEALFRIEGMEDVIPLSMDQITSFIHHLRRIYRFENSYHNFEHALDVLQATQSYLKSAGVVPPVTILFQPPGVRWAFQQQQQQRAGGGGGGGGGSLMATLGRRELFMLYVGAIGHDVGHPGFSNVFMKNAQSPLALLFNHGSALEHMHCHLLLQLMRFHGFAPLLDDPAHGAHLRRLLTSSVLATDMGVHGAFMERLQRVVRGEQMSVCARQVVLCEALLKNADISNPTRPFLVSKHWSTALLHEWTAQAHLEAQYHLQQTVPLALSSASPDSRKEADPLKEADSQIFFVRTFVRPLLELTEKAVPEMGMYVRWCRRNLGTWVRRREGLVREGKGGGGGGEGDKDTEEKGGSQHDTAEKGSVLDEQQTQEEEGVELVVNPSSPSPSLSSSSLSLSAASTSSTSTSTSTSLQNSPVPPPISPRFGSPSPSLPSSSLAFGTLGALGPSQLQYHTAFPLTLPQHPASLRARSYSQTRSQSRSYTASNSNSTSSASSSSGFTSRSGRSRSQIHSPALSASASVSVPASVPDSPSTETEAEASECRSVPSSSCSSINGNLSETSTLGLGAPSLSGMSVYSTSGLNTTAGSTASTTTTNAALAIRAASKVGMGSWRKKSQTGLNAHSSGFGGAGAYRGVGAGGGGAGVMAGVSRLPPLPAKVAASLSAGPDVDAASSSSSPSTLNGTGKRSAHGSGTNGTSTSSDASSNGLSTETEKTLKAKASSTNTTNSNSFRFKSSARNSWCATSVTGLDGLFGGQSGQSQQQNTQQQGQQDTQQQLPHLQPRRDISPLPPGKESWLGNKGFKGKEKEKEKETGEHEDGIKDKDGEKEDLETTPTATRVSITTSPRRGHGDGDEGSGRTSPSPGAGVVKSKPKSTSPGSILPPPSLLPPPPPPPSQPLTAPAPLMSGRAIKVQVSP